MQYLNRYLNETAPHFVQQEKSGLSGFNVHKVDVRGTLSANLKRCERMSSTGTGLVERVHRQTERLIVFVHDSSRETGDNLAFNV
ncbi:hypothetical protein NPIL_82591 [Nephila pilipes]|uniref:Uncharacterized protein n=1 Tax=Nephila pilipes TaxID=299642 RepID=A0A8X6TZQ7_NEPPI|nr:hypothetical protein NPIL_82591 [Nephila pilipes]